MRINSINHNYGIQKQNFKGIQVKRQEDLEAAGKMLDGKLEIFKAATDAKDIDIFLFGEVFKDGAGKNKERVPAYAGIIQYKQERQHKDGTNKAIASFKCPMTEEGLKDARTKIERAVIWANAPANLIANTAIDGLGKDDKQKAYIKNLQEKMIKAKCDNESIVWKQKLDMLITRDDNNI